jgi:hypothetical protein
MKVLRLAAVLAACLLVPAEAQTPAGSPAFQSLTVQGTTTSGGELTAPVTATGGTVPRLLADRMADFGLSALDTGAKCDGTTDDTTAIQTAINAAASKFGTVFFPAGKTCKISATLTITATGVKLQCQGGTMVGAAVAQCSLLWAGGASPMVSVTSPTATPIYYNGISNLTLDGNAAATVDIYVNGAQQGTIENVHLRQATTWALQSDTTAGGFATNTQGWLVTNLFVDGAPSTMGGVDLKCGDVSGAVYCSAFWTFINPQIATSNGTGMLFDGGSNNNILGGRIFGSAGSVSFDLSQYRGGTGSQSAIGNMFQNTYTQRAGISRGTTSIATCVPYAGTSVSPNTTCPYHNFFRLNSLSGGVEPTVEVGSQLNVQSDLNNRTTQQTFMGDAQYPGLVISNNLAGFGQCLNDALAAGAGTGQWQCSTSANAMATWDHGPNQDIWKWAFSGAAGARDLRLTPTTGTGSLRVDTGLFIKSYTVATLPACSGAVSGLTVLVSDQAAAPVYNAAPAGSGTTVAPVVCSAGTWHLH